MTYHLTYEAFEALVAELNTTDRQIEGTVLAGRQIVACKMWERFARCFDPPIPATAPYPKPSSCDPSIYDGREMARSTFLKRARQRTRSLHGYELGQRNVGKTRQGLGPAAAVQDVEHHIGTDDDDLISDQVAQAGFEQLRDLVRDQFRPRKRYQAEVTHALLAAVDEVEAGTQPRLIDAADELLRTWLPEEFGPTDAARKRRERARNDIGEFLDDVRPRFLDAEASSPA